MRPFEYHRIERTSDLRSAGRESAIIAGGTNLLDLMKLEVMAPQQVLDINRLDLAGIEETSDGGLTIGALVTNSDLAADMRVRKN